MTNKTTYAVIVIGENAPGGLLSVLQASPIIGKVNRATHPYQVKAFLRSQEIGMVFISVRDWNLHLFDAFHRLSSIPKLVIIKERLDRLDMECMRDNELLIKEPYTGIQIKNICAGFETKEEKKQALENYDCLWFLVDRKWRRIQCDDIELLQKHPQGQVLICTKGNDWMINSSLVGVHQKLPREKFARISEQLVIPANSKDLVHKTKGYSFRGGWMPVVRKMSQPSPQIIDTHEA